MTKPKWLPGYGPRLLPETEEQRRRILVYVRDHGPCKSAEMVEALDLKPEKIKSLLHQLRCLGAITFAEGAWEFIKMCCEPPKEAGPVHIVRNEAWHMPQPVTKTLPEGVRYTYQAAPTNRWGVEVKPGAGVISYDNPGLARLAK